MLKISSKKCVEARARKINIVRRVNYAGVSGLKPPFEEPVSSGEFPQVSPEAPQEAFPDVRPQAPSQEIAPQEIAPQEENLHPFFWKKPDGTTPSEIRWIWNPMTGDLHVGTQERHSEMTPRGTDWDSVLRGFYFPSKKIVVIRPFYWPDGTYDQWDEDHAALSADVQSTFVAAIEPTLKKQEPEIDFKTSINTNWLQSITGRYSW